MEDEERKRERKRRKDVKGIENGRVWDREMDGKRMGGRRGGGGRGCSEKWERNKKGKSLRERKRWKRIGGRWEEGKGEVEDRKEIEKWKSLG